MSTDKWCFKQTANLLSLGTHVCRHVCRHVDSRDTSPRHACLGEVSRKIWLHDFAINNNGGSVPVIFISLIFSERFLLKCVKSTTASEMNITGTLPPLLLMAKS